MERVLSPMSVMVGMVVSSVSVVVVSPVPTMTVRSANPVFPAWSVAEEMLVCVASV